MRISLLVILHLPVELRKIFYFFLPALFPEHLPTDYYFLPDYPAFKAAAIQTEGPQLSYFQ